MIFSKNRHTLKTSFNISGITIHSGEKSTITVSPNTQGTGIVFKVANTTNIPADYQLVSETKNATVISKDTHKVSTIEHLISALYALGVHDAYVSCTTAELPIMDGSSIDFVHAINNAGVEETMHPLSIVKITDTIKATGKDGAYIEISPYDGLYIDAKISFSHPAIRTQHFSQDINLHTYQQEIAPARTFGFMQDISYYQNHGLARGASTDTAVIFNEKSSINYLRFSDEPIRHKVLDIIGDIGLSPYPISGKITAYKMGHSLNNQLLKEIFQNPNTYCIIKT